MVYLSSTKSFCKKRRMIDSVFDDAVPKYVDSSSWSSSTSTIVVAVAISLFFLWPSISPYVRSYFSDAKLRREQAELLEKLKQKQQQQEQQEQQEQQAGRGRES